MRSGLERLLREEREREIAEAYRRAYANREPDPAERLVGESGLALSAGLLRREDPDAA